MQHQYYTHKIALPHCDADRSRQHPYHRTASAECLGADPKNGGRRCLNPKSQAPSSKQILKNQSYKLPRDRILKIEVWNFLGNWDLDIGILNSRGICRFSAVL